MRLLVAVQDIQEKAMTVFEEWWNGLPEARRNEIAQARPVVHDFHASPGWVTKRHILPESEQKYHHSASRCCHPDSSLQGQCDRFH
jgi:hypothetical protein